MVRSAGFLLLLFLCGCAAPSVGDGDLVILSYNVQNIFDSEVDGSEYEDLRTVDEAVYHLRLASLAQVIRNTLPPPDILVLQEIEDEDVPRELLATYLPEYGYSQVHLSGPEESATQVAVITHLPVTHVATHAPPSSEHHLRNILEVRLESAAGPVTLLANHWKSRRNGGEELRAATASLVRRRVDALAARAPDGRFILAGDFNTEPVAGGSAPVAIAAERPNPEGLEVTELMSRTGGSGAPWPLFSPWALSEEEGSYRYSGNWERIDAFYLSRSLLEGRGFTLSSFEVHPWEELRNAEGSPRRWIEDLRSGYSDHLPVILILSEE